MVNLRALAIPEPTVAERVLSANKGNKRLILAGLEAAIESQVKKTMLDGIDRKQSIAESTEDRITRVLSNSMDQMGFEMAYRVMVQTASRMLAEQNINKQEVREYLADKNLKE